MWKNVEFKASNNVMFRGAHAVSLDAKGRFAVPSSFRDNLHDLTEEGHLICTIDIAHACLLLYPLPEWEKIEEHLKKLSNMQPVERRLQRLLLGYASECTLDAQMRVHLAASLREHAGLNKELMLIGQLNKLEIWDKATWQKQIDEDLQKLPQTDWIHSQRLGDFSL